MQWFYLFIIIIIIIIIILKNQFCDVAQVTIIHKYI